MLGIPGSAGVPEEFVEYTLALPYNNVSAVEEAFTKFKGKIVCYDPTSPGPGAGAIAAMAKVLGMDYVTKLIKDQQVKFVQNSDQEMQPLLTFVGPGQRKGLIHGDR